MSEQSAKVRVLLVDDEKLIRQGLRVLLSLNPRIEIVGEAADGLEAISLAAELNPQVVLMDIRMPNLDGREATRVICEQNGGVRVLILTTFSDMQYIREAMRNGASGYLLKDSSPELIAESILAVAKDVMAFHPDIASKLLDPPPAAGAAVPLATAPSSAAPQAAGAPSSAAPQAKGAAVDAPSAEERASVVREAGLSTSQVDIIKLVASGHSNNEIAEILYLSEGTIKNKISIILQTLNLRDRTQLAIFAWENHIMDKK